MDNPATDGECLSNASEFAFKAYAWEHLSSYKEWTRLSPSDWICLLSEATYNPDIMIVVKKILCKIYAPDLVGADGIVFYFNPSTSMQAVVVEIPPGYDLGYGQHFGWDHDAGIPAKRFVTVPGRDYAGVFATYDQEHKLVALSVSIERCGCQD